MTDCEIIPITDGAGEAVAMTVFRDALFVACEYAVFTLVDGKLVPVPFVGIEQRSQG